MKSHKEQFENWKRDKKKKIKGKRKQKVSNRRLSLKAHNMRLKANETLEQDFLEQRSR